MKTKHTQGEWRVSKSGNPQFKTCVVAEDMGSVCFITDWTEEEAKANAKIISAAPELLESLKQLMEGVDGLPPLTAITGTLTKQYKQAQQAIKKATE